MSTNSNFLTIYQASKQIADGQLSPTALAAACLKQIDRLEPKLKAWVTIDRDAVQASAQTLEKELEKRGPRGPLHGIPVGIKDIYYTAGMKTTACSKVYADFIPEYDATAVARLKAAGAIVLGKTVTTEFAAGDPSPTLNPWDFAHTPGGSSSGSAVSVAARMCPAAMGSQTGGSILRPASYNGIVGLKPTFGRISVYGVIPVAWSFDTIGPMVNCVDDAAIMLQALAGYDDNDPGSADEPVPDYLYQMQRFDKPPRIGIIRDFMAQANAEVQKCTREAAQKLADAGAVVEEVSAPPSYALSPHFQWVIGCVENAAYHEEQYRTKADLYSHQIRRRMEVGFLTPGVQYLQAQRLRRVYRREMEALARQWDVLLTPSTPAAAPDTSTTGDPVFQSPWTSCGLPTITIPSGLSPSTGLPLGVQFASAAFTESRLLGAARWCERILGVSLTPPIAK
jgi:aspartyl-tRNA(Asn)/glutamyl-tRNA(Gln) amidotransferase subunit A